MLVARTIEQLRATLAQVRSSGRSVGFVPTMGALHAGHTSLVDRAVAAHPFVVASIFVNPLQFAPTEDLASYPRPFERDVELVEAHGGQLVFAPSVEAMYPQPIRTTVHVAEVSAPLEGRHRPTHFDGVSTVVAKLFNIVGPCHAYFGEKDWQQLAVVRRMVADLDVPVTVVGCPTVRESDGLAMSSRNVYLTAPQRAAAPALHRALQEGAAAIEAGERDPARIRRLMGSRIEAVAELDYADVVDAASLAPVDPLAGELRLLVAARFGKARLIDNVGVWVP